MTALEVRDRSYLFDQALIYLFSYDVECAMDREDIGFVPGGARVNIMAKPNRSRVYHILRESTVGGLGAGSISGKLLWGGDRVFWREDDIEYSEVSLAIHTDDGAQIDMEYENVTSLGPGGYRRLISGKPKFGSEDEPLDWHVMITPRFRTTSQTYGWLHNYQGLGFGRVRVIKSEVRRISYDVYVMT